MLIPSIDLQNGSVVQLVQGEKLGGLNFRHPLYDVDAAYKRLSPVYLADYATAGREPRPKRAGRTEHRRHRRGGYAGYHRDSRR